MSVATGRQLEVTYELMCGCDWGGEQPGRSCGTYIDRKAAFAANEVQDPLKYED